MQDVAVQMGQLLTILIMAVALGMDAFSLGIGIGLRGIRLWDALRISLLIAFFHLLMPLIGLFMGHYVGDLLGDVATLTGGALLILLGGHMIYSSFSDGHTPSFDHRTFWGMLLFAISCSIDSLSVGLSLGLFDTDLFLTVMLFGAFGGLMSILGLLVGRHAGRWMGEYGEALGGVVLVAFGIRFLI